MAVKKEKKLISALNPIRQFLLDFKRMKECEVIEDDADEEMIDYLLTVDKKFNLNEYRIARAEYLLKYSKALIEDAQDEMEYIRSESGNISSFEPKFSAFLRELVTRRSELKLYPEKGAGDCFQFYLRVKEEWNKLYANEKTIIRQGKSSYFWKFSALAATLTGITGAIIINFRADWGVSAQGILFFGIIWLVFLAFLNDRIKNHLFGKYEEDEEDED